MEEVSSGESALQTRPPLLSAGTSSFSVHPAPAHTYPGAASLSGSLLRLLPLPVEYGPDLLRYIRPHVPPLPVSEAVSGLPRAEECLSPFFASEVLQGPPPDPYFPHPMHNSWPHNFSEQRKALLQA